MENIISKIKKNGFLTLFKDYPTYLKNRISLIKYSKINDYASLKKHFEKKKGLEIGGPSLNFNKNGFIPVYNIMDQLDGVNFSSSTFWTEEEKNNKFIVNDEIVGDLFIIDASDLSIVPDNEYDFILSSHNIEHLANPLKSVEKQISKLKEGGVIVIVAPRKESNYDNKRNVVKFEHLLEDYNKNVGEDDSSHFEEVISLHNLARDFSEDYEKFKEVVHDNINNRRLHQHVFDLDVLEQILLFFNMKIIKKDFRQIDYTIIAKK